MLLDQPVVPEHKDVVGEGRLFALFEDAAEHAGEALSVCGHRWQCRQASWRRVKILG